MKKSYNYTVLDVFTETVYTGNQLAVVYVDGELDKLLYDQISREFGYSETSFVYYSPIDKALRIRSFTSTGFEIHGAGHNLLGVVSDALIKGESIFREQTGTPYVIMKGVPIYLEIDDLSGIHIIGMKQRTALFEKNVPVQELADGLSINIAGFSDDILPTVVATEVAHLMVPLKSIDALDKAYPNKKALSLLSKKYGFEGVYCFNFKKRGKPHIVETRFFNPLIGIDEDPATGSAAGPLAGFLYANGYIDLDTPYQLLQGKIMKRPSILRFKVTDEGISVSGSSVITMQGQIFI